MSLLEVVPNVSEGRDPERIAELRAALEAEPGVALLDLSSDPDHHRSVLTAAGRGEALERAVLRLYRAAAASLDLRRHRGAHPRLGVVDVVPFVPLGATSMAEAVEVAASLGRRVGEELGIPVFLYGEAAPSAERRAPAALRRGGLDAIVERLAAGSLRPDFGPARVDPRVGVTLVGARGVLVAFNVELRTADVRVARAIARSIRERDGGLPGVQALGLYLESRGRAQVSTNLLRPLDTTPAAVLDRIRAEAERLGAAVDSWELVGLVPEGALRGAAAGEAPELARVGAGQILERRLAEEGILLP